MTRRYFLDKYKDVVKDDLPLRTNTQGKYAYNNIEEEILLAYFMLSSDSLTDIAEWAGVSVSGIYKILKKTARRLKLTWPLTLPQKRRRRAPKRR